MQKKTLGKLTKNVIFVSVESDSLSYLLATYTLLYPIS
jgi:hypothetical protein